MDELSTAFAQTAEIRMIEACNDLNQLKKLAIQLVKARYTSKDLILKLMRDQLTALSYTAGKESV